MKASVQRRQRRARRSRTPWRWNGWALLVASAAPACVVHTNTEWIRDAASRDLGCPKGKLHITHYTNDPNKKRVEGCGQNVVYEKVCGDQTCTWRRKPTPPPPPAAQ